MVFTLVDYPVVIEPTVAVLEAKVGDDQNDRSKDHWAPLHRIPLEEVQAMAAVPAGIPHFFGRSPVVTENTEFLCYSAGGVLSHVLYLQKGEWNMTTVPAEIVGQPTALPSVRMVFKTPRARDAFLMHVRQILGGQVSNPALELVFDQLAEPVRVLEVYQIEEE